MILLDEVKKAVHLYSIQFPNDVKSLQPLHDAMSPSITLRTNFPIHITTSAVMVNLDSRIWHIKHKILKKWLLPGGHCEDTDHSLIEASLREAVEETAISSDCLIPIQEGNVPIDIDLHDIPNNPGKNEPAHWHADFRFVFRLDSSQKITIQQEEVTDFAWLSLEEMPMPLLANKLNDLTKQGAKI